MRKMGVRLLSAAVALGLALGLAAPAGAEQIETNGILSDEMGIITGYAGPGGDVTIPAKNQYGGEIVGIDDALGFNRQTGAITAFALEAGDTWFQVKEGVLFNCYGDELISYPKASSRSEYTIPSGVTYVRDGAFLGAKHLKSVTFPTGEYCGIGDYAFADCTSLTGITFQSGCRANAGEHAFSGCTSLKRLILPNGTETLGDFALDGCTALEVVGIPGTVSAPLIWFSGETPTLMVCGEAGSQAEIFCKNNALAFRTVEDYDAFFAQHDTGPTAPAAALPDGRPSIWAEKDVVGARAAGLLPAVLDGGYTRDITRAEFCALVCAYADAMGISNGDRSLSFPDTADPQVLRAASLGVITGYSDGTFGPDSPIRRDEAAVMLARLARLTGSAANAPVRAFSDGGAIGTWAKADVGFVTGCVVAQTGVAVMNGTSADTFGPAGTYTREQAFTTFYRLWRYAGEKPVRLVDAGLEKPVYMDCTVVVRDDTLLFHNAPAGTYLFSGLTTGSGLTPKGTTGADGTLALDLSGLTDGRYSVQVTPSLRAVAVAMPTDGIWAAPPGSGGFGPGDLVKSGHSYYWAAPPDYAENLRRQAEEDKRRPPQACLDPEGSIQADDPAIRALAAQLTAGLDSEYAKALAIHDWVCENIAYDVDTFVSDKSGVSRSQDAASVLESRLAVCEGYSCLTAALLRSAGIPARVAVGYAGPAGAYASWPPVELEQTNHAWNEAWVDGHWILLDTTWDCGKKKIGRPLDARYADSPDAKAVEALLSDGERPTSYTYFDPDPMVFSAEHRTVQYSLQD